MISRVIKKTVDLDTVQKVDQLEGPLYQLEESGHTFEITCMSGGTAAAVSGTVSGRFLRADETTVYFTGTLSGNVASITLPQSCYNVNGRFGFVVFVSGRNVTSAIYAVAGNVYRSTSETIIDPTGEIPSLEELMAEIEACEEATASAQQAASFVNSIIAPTYSTGVSYAIGDYCTYEGSMYRATAATSGAFDSDDWEMVLVGGEFQRVYEDIDNVESDLAGRMLSDEVKNALLACFQNVAWTTPDGQTYYDALESALNPPANLSYITAVYTQTMTVETIDPITVLRDDLVVTAHYGDGTSSRVYGYLLSGTLTVGTSTVTVTYGGKTSTFSVTVSPAYLTPGRTYTLNSSDSWQMSKGMNYVSENNGKTYNEMVVVSSTGSRALTYLFPVAPGGITLKWNSNTYQIFPSFWDTNQCWKYMAFNSNVYLQTSPSSYSESDIATYGVKYFAIGLGRKDNAPLSEADITAANIQLEVL